MTDVSAAITAITLACTALSRSAHGDATVRGLIHHWPADGDAADAVGSADGTINGAVSYGDGRFGASFHIASGASITFPPPAGEFGRSDFTVSFWCRMDRAMRAPMIAKRGTCDRADFYEIDIRLDGDVLVEIADGESGVTSLLTRSADVHDGQWHHVAWRRASTMQTVFVDGCALVTPVATTVADVNIDALLTLGMSPCVGGAANTVPFEGAIDEVQLYARALEDGEIRLLAHAEMASDLSSDGKVGAADLALMLAAWGQCTACCAADLNGDNVVDAADLGAMLGAWSS
ncbi:MAG: LamG domain-containing protein [Phycisphaerae bacterium]|nr:LamG domain-containing protein [Phycisphaerae bacterium]